MKYLAILCCLSLAIMFAQAAPRRSYSDEDRAIRSKTAKYRRAEYEPWESRERDVDGWEARDDRRPTYDYEDDRYADSDLDDDYPPTRRPARRPARTYPSKSSRYTASERSKYRSLRNRRFSRQRLGCQMAARQEAPPPAEVAPVEPESTNTGNPDVSGFKFPEFPSASFAGGFGAAVSIS